MAPRKAPEVNLEPIHPVEQTALDALLPHPMNPRKGNVDKIVESIKVNGFYGVIVAQKSTKYILAGNHRWQAARHLDLASVPVMWIDCTDAEAKRIMLADNRMSDLAGYNQDSLQDLLRSVVSDGDLRGTGFDMKDIQTLIDDVTDEPNDKRKRNLEPFEDSFFLIRCPVTDQGRAMRMIQEALQDVVGVEIASATR
ncbi:ParB/Sulfiredoxin [uncultured Caudovirales phage]|jgi:hypothetical protein|uniref:ParB/Sulfiredoxin n=1 Tax=uncultured Caudovirales phage TaxID=2100421 RepID=A0A6J5PI46_9CAUD|nr:ParB/Sulfiredoxin [uncultured Caudovirales phage]CAB4169596.1 ParB/Sulfiredoxin [uncultured Caudovirales phage]CAB4196200.1 ParB/Sulfiredoxin [uncultured Caudovirales phage]